MCVLFSIKYVYISVRGVTLLDMSIHGSSYVSSSGPFILRIHFVVCFESEMSGLLLGALGHCPFHHCVRYWRDFLSYLIWADHHLFSYFMLHHHPRFHFCFIIFYFASYSVLIVTSLSGLVLSSHHHYTSRHQFGFSSLHHHSYHVHSRHLQVHGSRYFLYMLHFIHEGMGFDHWVFEPSFPSFLSPYHPSLRYVLSLKTTLRP